MTIAVAYWCILIAAALPYVWVYFAKYGAPGYNNRNPRGWIAKQSDYRVQRANGAHLNAFEAFAPFAAGVLMAQAAGVAHERIALLAVVFIIARIAHGLLYLADKQALRSLAWLIGFVCVIALIVQAALKIA